MTKQEELANKIVNHFMSQGATVSKVDYDYVMQVLTLLLLEPADEDTNPFRGER